MKKIFLVVVLLYNINIIAQEDKIVTIKVAGIGKTLEEAKNNALASAVKQTLSTYLLSKVEINYDNITNTDLLSIETGTIQNHNIVSHFEIPNIGFITNINVEVSLSKLISYAKSKGIDIEIPGGAFGAKIKQQILNENSEINGISNVFGLIHELMQMSFDYKILVKEPVSNSLDSKSWKIPITIEAYGNDNFTNVCNILNSSLENLSLSKNEYDDYKNLGKEIFVIRIKHNKTIKEYYLRKLESLNLLKNIELNWFFYTSNFNVHNNFENIFLINRFYYYYDGYPYYKYQLASKNNGQGESITRLSDEDIFLPYLKMFHVFFDNNSQLTTEYLQHNLNLNLDLIKSTTKCLSLDFNDIKTLEQLEKLSEYKINSSGIISSYKFGGYLVEETSEKYTILAPFDLIHDNRNLKSDIGNKIPDDICNWFIGLTSCEKFNLNQFKDWQAPKLNDLKNITNNLFLKGIGCDLSFTSKTFWSIEEKDKLNSYVFPFYRNEVLNSKTRKEYFNSDSNIYVDKNNFYNSGSTLVIRPIRYQYKTTSLDINSNDVKNNTSNNLLNESILIFKSYEESDLVYYIFEDLNGKSYDFSAMPQPEKYELIDKNYNINSKFLNKKFKIKWKAIPGTSEEYGYPYNEIISIELID